jgi:hypothetical protein
MSPELTKQWLELANQVPDCGLYDQGLQDIDPFDEELDVGVQLRIWEEAKRNPRYFFMRILKVGPFVVDSLDKMAMGMFPGRWTEMSEDSVLAPIFLESVSKEVGKQVSASMMRAFAPGQTASDTLKSMTTTQLHNHAKQCWSLAMVMFAHEQNPSVDRLVKEFEKIERERGLEGVQVFLIANEQAFMDPIFRYDYTVVEVTRTFTPKSEPATIGRKIPIVDGNGHLTGYETYYPTVRVPPSLQGEDELTAVIKDMGKDQAAEALIAIGKASPGITPWGTLPDRKHSHARLCDPGIKGFPEPEPLREIPDEPLIRAKIAAEIWQGIVNDGELGRTNDQVEYLFTKRVRELYGNEFLRVKVDGLTATVQHLVWGTWKTL